MMIGTTIRQYRIIAELKPGKGGMGDLFLAEHVSLPKHFAIKCLKPALTQDPQFHKRFFQEAQDQALLDHPNIVQAIDFFEEGGQFFFVMQFVEGQDLDNLIKTQGKLPEDEALRIFEGILEGLKFAHSKGIVHRDMKPSNVLIDEDGRPRITDFGIAILAGVERLTATGTTIGTPWYMSPEQIRAPKNVDHRADIYSAGIVLYEMLAGDVPFDGETDFSIKEQQVNSPAPNPRLKNPAISEKLSAIILKAMEKNPDNRFQNCGEFLNSIRAFREKVRPTPTPFIIPIIAAVLVIGIGIAVYVILREPPKPAQDDQGQHESALLLIRDASEKASIVCLQLKEIELRQKNRAIAQDLGKTALVDGYTQQITDREKNVINLTSEYINSVTKLGILKKMVVKEEFQNYGNELLTKQSFEKIKYLRLVQRHYEQSLGYSLSKIDLGSEACSLNQ